MTDKASAMKPADWSDRSYYLAMPDGVRLAVSLYFPGHAPPAVPSPTLLVLTRYGRAAFRRSGDPRGLDPWLEAGFVVSIVDVRGTTASFGARDSEIGPDEQRDAETVIAHLAVQNWSDGKVVLTGVSYTADTADMATTRDAPALVAAIPRQTDFDFWELFWPGGIANESMFLDWSAGVYEIDFGRPRTQLGAVVIAGQAGADVRQRAEDAAKLFPTLQPVDEDPNGAQLRDALTNREADRRHWSAADYAAADFRDDKGRNGHGFFDAGTGAHLAAVRRQGKPVQYWGSWVDANTAEGALNRYRATPDVPSVVIITPNDHGGGFGADPFYPERLDPIPAVAEQNLWHLAFARDVLAGRTPPRVIRYYVLGAAEFRETTVWPPCGVEDVQFLLDQAGQLTRRQPEAGVDTYRVDASASTGKQNRWYQFTRPAYGDRREADRKLLTYDTPPMAEDTELVGWPVVTLRMQTATDDPAVFAYIEDVAPDGRVTYVTEGQLRAVHRRPADPATLPYDPGPVPHSFNRADALAVVPGEVFTSGHRIRLAIAGADRDTFRPLSNDQAEQFDVHRGGLEPSGVKLPLRAWR
ncbi:MAG: CocE/NonD family hydrolase [Alphaproteobacteria bacterium]|nr:CocE/NonD family hydrolase [Alphaproteobacteria bacterium]